ncbi:MAG: radical SAM protein, partial [Bacteroidales bacterium]|nr:radical SAM protein [Bacteroidales bacterium]
MNMPLFNLLKKLSFKKITNYLLLRFSFISSSIFKKPFIYGKPVVVAFEPTNYCNLRCPECPSGTNGLTRAKGFMDMILFHKIIKELTHELISMIFYFQGEPFLHPQFLDLIKSAKKHKIYTSTSTNAHFIDEIKAKEIVKSGLDRLIISIDGLTQKTYENYRINGKLEKVISGTKHLIKAKKKFGQNFLKDESVLEKIIQSKPKDTLSVVEIGPGLGDLTQKLLTHCEKVVAFEIDLELCGVLREKFFEELSTKQLTLECTDVLEAWGEDSLLEEE